MFFQYSTTLHRGQLKVCETPHHDITKILTIDQDELLELKETSRLDDTEFAQPICTAIQVALVDTLAEYGIKADAVVGHSSGEIAAAYAAGGLDASEAIVAAYQRGQIAKGRSNAGGMAAVGLGRDQVAEYLVGRNEVVVACENSPNSVTISGESEGLNVVLAAIKTKEPECFTRKLRVNVAYHSRKSCRPTLLADTNVYRSHEVGGKSIYQLNRRPSNWPNTSDTVLLKCLRSAAELQIPLWTAILASQFGITRAVQLGGLSDLEK